MTIMTSIDELIAELTSPMFDQAGQLGDAAHRAAQALQSLQLALVEIREAVAKRQLPITNQVFEIADAALTQSKDTVK